MNGTYWRNVRKDIMSKSRNYVALDLGAGSGRAMLGSLRDGRLVLEEAHRFSNDPVSLPDGLYWDVLRLWGNLKTGITRAAEKAGAPLDGLAVDTWGVDYGLLDGAGRLLGNPYNYRDARTDGMMDAAFAKVSQADIFKATGIQFMQINTLYQLLAQVEANDPRLQAAERLLLMPDLFNYWFTGEARAEQTIASTSQCYDPRAGTWATEMLKALNIPCELFADIVMPGTKIGALRTVLADELGVDPMPVIAVGSHDTASAVAAVPFTGSGEAFLSSGTWSLLGTESPQPVITEASLRYNFTNEAGVSGTTRLLKNITGLWITQEMRRVWTAAGEKISYDDMADLAQTADPFTVFIDGDDPLFMPPGDMCERIAQFAQQTGQPVPADRAAFIRAAFESLVFKYRAVLDMLETLTGEAIHTLHIVGGGTRNTFLNRWIASATGRTVKTGPSEATAAGNVLLQMMATGELNDLAAGRECIRQSFPSETFEPEDQAPWDAAYPRYREILERQG